MSRGPAMSVGGIWRDPALWMALPATLFMLLVFVYPFLDGLRLSFMPAEGGGAFANTRNSSTRHRCF